MSTPQNVNNCMGNVYKKTAELVFFFVKVFAIRKENGCTIIIIIILNKASKKPIPERERNALHTYILHSKCISFKLDEDKITFSAIAHIWK